MNFVFFVLSLMLSFCNAMDGDTYTNPVVARSLPDPTLIRGTDGDFYLYATEDIRNMPIYRSKDLTNWVFEQTAFTNATRPTFEPGGLWAPDINYINGQYVLYYSMSVWGGIETCGIGRAVADWPQGPFTDLGKLFRSNEIGVKNSIDPFYIEGDDGTKYLFWGSFNGIFYVELSDDGLTLKNPLLPQPKKVAGTAFEATYIHKRGAYYYLFASVGSCCAGLNSTYKLVVGRSTSLTGPYVNKEGYDMKMNYYSLVIGSSGRFVGNGHCSEIVQDDAGSDWILFHGWDVNNEQNGRVLLLNQIQWDDNDWPYVDNRYPALTAAKPVFGTANGLDEAGDAPFNIRTDGDKVLVESSRPADVKVYTLAGALTASAEKTHRFRFSLVPGHYIIQITRDDKVIVRKIHIEH
jgi:arabinan endo-1,5-alpha-L-arabinosidase